MSNKGHTKDGSIAMIIHMQCNRAHEFNPGF